MPRSTRPGFPTRATARAALKALHESVALLKSGRICGVVTGPVCKRTLAEIGFPHPGQTEFFAKSFGVDDVAMVLTGRRLTVGLVTAHIPFREVRRHLRRPAIVRTGRLLHDFLFRRGRRSPRIAVAGLNPHAGESGVLGNEEIDVVAPAVRALQSEFPDAFTGPLPPDTMFRRVVAGEFDAALCLYHDQGLIPLKLLDFDNAVNVTAGLPFARTSPDHGTAFDIAGRGIADPSSFIAAVNLAAELTAPQAAQRSLP